MGNDPRVFFNGDDVPAGVWTYRVEPVADEEGRMDLLGYDGEPCGNGNLGPLVEVLIPDDLDGIVARAAAARGLVVCTGCYEQVDERDVGSRAGVLVACHSCADIADPQ